MRRFACSGPIVGSPPGASSLPQGYRCGEIPGLPRYLWELACQRLAVTLCQILLRSMAKPAQVWLTGISSRLLMLMCAGVLSTQKIVSAMSCGWIGSAPA